MVTPIGAYVRHDNGRYLEAWYNRLRDAYLATMADLGVYADKEPQEFLAATDGYRQRDPELAIAVSAIKGVEGQVGYLRRNYLTPVPRVDSLDELNAKPAEFEAKENERRIGARIRTIAQDFAREAGHLLPLPDDPFTTGITLTPRVDRYGLITVKMCRYSVPVRHIGSEDSRTGPGGHRASSRRGVTMVRSGMVTRRPSGCSTSTSLSSGCHPRRW